MAYKARFDGSTSTSVGMSSTFLRNSASVNAVGDDKAVNVARFDSQRLACGAPLLQTVDSGVSTHQVWGGHWRDGTTACLVQVRGPESAREVRVEVGTYGVAGRAFARKSITVTSGTKIGRPDILWGTSTEEPDWVHSPDSFVIGDGLVLAFCRATRRLPSGAWEVQSSSVCYWYEPEDDPEANSEWRLIERLTPETQIGKPRGQIWVGTGPWARSRGSGAITEFFAAWTDYINRGSDPNDATGGSLSIVRCKRSSTSAAWEDAPRNRLIYREEASTQGTHFHTGSVIFPSDDVMVVTLAIGDSGPNNRLIKFTRVNGEEEDFFDTFDAGDHSIAAADSATPVDKFPPNVPTPTSPPNALGWTTFEEREGQRQRISVPDGSATGGSAPFYVDSSPAAFANYTQPSGEHTPFVFVTDVHSVSGDPSVWDTCGIISKVSSSRVEIDRDISAIWKASHSKKIGYVYADGSTQPVPQLPTSMRDEILFGVDEGMSQLMLAKITETGTDKIQMVLAHGTPTDLITNVNNPDEWGNWVILYATCANPAEGKSYAASVHPGTIQSTIDPAFQQGSNQWRTTKLASVILYSPDSTAWGDLVSTNSTANIASGFFGTAEGVDYFYLGSDGTNQTALLKTKVPKSFKMQPLLLAPGGTNHITSAASLAFASGGSVANGHQVTILPYKREFESGDPVGTLYLTDFASEIDFAVPKPPCMGPIFRVQFKDDNYAGVWKISDSSVLGSSSIKIRFWIFALPPKPDQASPNVFPPAAAGATLRLRLGWINSAYTNFFANTKSRHMDTRAAHGAGWIPITASVPAGLFDPADPMTVCMEVLGGSSFSRQDVLIAFDCVLTGAQVAELTALPIPPGNPTPEGENLTLSWTSTATFAWSCFVALQLPESGPDPFTSERFDINHPPSLFTLRQSSTAYLTVSINRVSRKIVLRDHNDATLELEGPTSPINQPFMFWRERQVLVGISRYLDLSTHTTKYRMWASVGGSQVTFVEGSLATVTPQAWINGEHDGTHAESMRLFGVYYDRTNSNLSVGKMWLEDLAFLEP
jgi:hypothetical protein